MRIHQCVVVILFIVRMVDGSYITLHGDNDEFLLAVEKSTFGVGRRIIIIIHSDCLAGARES